MPTPSEAAREIRRVSVLVVELLERELEALGPAEGSAVLIHALGVIAGKYGSTEAAALAGTREAFRNVGVVGTWKLGFELGRKTREN